MTMEQQAEHNGHHAMTLTGLQKGSKRGKRGPGGGGEYMNGQQYQYHYSTAAGRQGTADRGHWPNVPIEAPTARVLLSPVWPLHCVVVRLQRLKLPCLSTKRSG